MLEGVVARILNQLLGKYVADLDTENFNVGIFSGQVQLTDLKLKTEALYELNLPIEVIAGTIGKIWIQIPWNYLWNKPVLINIEDVHILCGPVVAFKPFDEEKNKRLLRAFKLKTLKDLQTNGEVIGGPSCFSEYLIANIVNNLQFAINNIHIRYEDSVSTCTPLSAGICIGNITAETTNSKWKPCDSGENDAETSYYLVKIEAVSSYFNPVSKPSQWEFPSQYYLWRNAMASSLQNFSMNGQEFEFLLKPMSAKIKTTINRKGSNIHKVTSDLIIQDCNMQVTREQYYSLLLVSDSLQRMFSSWNFLSIRPSVPIFKDTKSWWNYACKATIEQRIKPYTWSRIKTFRQQYRQYTDAYKKFILNPNDTELKLDLQKYEDNLSVVNIVIAQQQARLTVNSSSFREKNLWSLLPSPERTTLCGKIGFEATESSPQLIEHVYNVTVGNVGFSLVNKRREILMLTLTQFNLAYMPNFLDESYKLGVKVEGFVVEGASAEEHLVVIACSEHLINSPAYFLKIDLEKFVSGDFKRRFGLTMDSVEITYHRFAFDEIQRFVYNEYFVTEDFFTATKNILIDFYNVVHQKLTSKWDLNFDIKIPFVVIPEIGCFQKAENIFVLDLGRYVVTTEICEDDLNEFTTQMELEEKIYSRLCIENSGMQLLFCESSENWRDARKEKDTELHLIPKSGYSAIYSSSARIIKAIPRYKFFIKFPTLKFNLSERKILMLFKLMNSLERLAENGHNSTTISTLLYPHDVIKCKFTKSDLVQTQNSVSLITGLTKIRRHSKCDSSTNKNRKMWVPQTKMDINKAWARAVDLPGLEDNISPSNNIITLLRITVNEFTAIFSRSSDSTDRQYLTLRIGVFSMDAALLTYGPAYQFSVNSFLLTDKLHTTPSGQYLDLVYSPFPSKSDVVTVLFRKVDASCPEFWSHFHGVETSLVADLGTVHFLVHEDAVRTIVKYFHYVNTKFRKQISSKVLQMLASALKSAKLVLRTGVKETPVPPGAVKFSYSTRLSDLNIRICDSDFDIMNIYLSGLEADVLFRANERFVFRSFLSSLTVEHLSDVTLYSKVLYTDEDKVYEFKYVRYNSDLNQQSNSGTGEVIEDGSFTFHLGQIHVTFLYKLFVQLQRLLINIEGLPFIENVVSALCKLVTRATDTLKSSTKIKLSVNISSPILLFPQKSSSPNVIIVNAGELIVENFFKRYYDDTVENILIKLNNVMISRGIMTLTSSLEMQENIIEPLSLHMDTKRFLYTKSQKSLCWDIDGALDSIQITLGQRDISIITAIYSDNIGEGQLVDLLPPTMKSPVVSKDTNDAVKVLESFFCEPKQKYMTAKLTLESFTLLLFFDSGELLSSPIRDLNHGLSKFELYDVSTSFVMYSDRSLDGRLSVDTIKVEEIGPTANKYDKAILQAPAEDNRNNNCNITVNKPPIVDVTYHQNESGDKSTDVIIGQLRLTLSVPFCEKVAMFVLECLPKESTEIGIVNLGYVGEERSESTTVTSSLTVSLRINKPEFIFLIETTSNKKRYFLTTCEILSDYACHSNRLNFVLSLSSLHTLFYDYDVNSGEPYTVLKHCDVEFSKCFSSEKGNKVTTTVSSIYIQICSRIVHSIDDILNDITEHFRVPDAYLETKRKSALSPSEPEDLWEPKKLPECVLHYKTDPVEHKLKVSTVREVFLMPKVEVILIFELEEVKILLIKTTAEITIYDWSSFLSCTCEFTLQANYFNENLQAWEPFVDPVFVDESDYKPWDVLVKIFQDKPLPILQNTDGKLKGEADKAKKNIQSSAATDDESGEDMVYIEPANSSHGQNNRRVKTSLSTFLDDSDSENEDGAMQKLAAAISDLFTGDWNENEDSESEESSDTEDESEENVHSSQNVHASETIDYKKSTYIIIDAKETLNVTITPALLKVLNEIITVYSSKTLSLGCTATGINIVNDIGPHSKVDLYENLESGDSDSVFVCSKMYENQESCPNSPSKLAYALEDVYEDKESVTDESNVGNCEINYDLQLVSSLQFPQITSPELFQRINKYQLKIHVPGFTSLQTNCSNRVWEKLLRLHSEDSVNVYHLAAKHTVGKFGRNVTVSSPLQVRNETCFALSLLYQPSVLQQYNIEPIGDFTNPFETTMRIAVLEPHEQYNVPLHIAYLCKLFIQPAYAESHYASDCAIQWQDLLADLNVAHTFYCKPKTDSNVEVFAMRVKLERNVAITNSHAHTIPNYIICILPPLVLHNFLPYPVEVQNADIKQQINVEPGEKNSVYCLDLSKDLKLVIKMKLSGGTWSGTLNFSAQLEEKIVVLSWDGNNGKQIAINVRVDREGSCNMYIYSSYWIVNKTGLPLHIKTSATNVVYEAATDNIVLFTYKRHQKQTLNVKVYDSDWSNDFGLECAGTTGLIVCKDNERKKRYSFLMSVKLSEMCPRLTKIVTLLPCFLVANQTRYNLRVMEHNEKTDLWIDLPLNQCVTFWPETSSMQMYVKFRGSKTQSQAFYFSNVHHTVLRMDKGAAICVDVTGGKTEPFRVLFNDYKSGDAPVLIKNYCADVFMKIQQQGLGQVNLVSPCKSLLYTWDDPTKSRMLMWNIYNNKSVGFIVDIAKDGQGEEKISFRSVTPGTTEAVSSSSEDSDSSDSAKLTLNKKVHRDKIVIYWLCHREGVQRTLVFAQDQKIVKQMTNAAFLEYCDKEWFVSLSGIGVSLFTNPSLRREQIYCAVSDTPPIWEVNVGRKWKMLTLELASWIEDKYSLHYKKCQLKDYIHIDFEKMFMLKPFFAELRRTYNPGVYVQLRKSENYQYVSFKLQSLQVDNNKSSSSEPIILYHPPSENVRAQIPFVEVNLLKTCQKNYDIYKHVKINVRDFSLNVEDDLFVQLNTLIAESFKFVEETTTLYRNDMAYVGAPVHLIQKNMQRNYSTIETFHLSKVTVKLNVFNNTKLKINGPKLFITKCLDYLFPLNMSPYMSPEGVLHKIAPLQLIELNCSFFDIITDITNHITTQFLQQYYSQVLGQQVLVNPYASQTIVGCENSNEDSDKVASILQFGCRCVLGHINMSPAALEQCIVDIFANQNIENIQRIRRHGSYQKCGTIPKSVSYSSKDFKIGVPLALEQMIIKPNKKTACSNGELFFRGPGKALYSLIIRNPDEKSNSVQVAIEAVRRAALLGEPIKIHRRLIRFYNAKLGLKPYSVYESMGYYLLETLGNGRFVNDTYWAHTAIDRTRNSMLVVSLEHIVRINKCGFWGNWEIEWCLNFDEILSIPKMTSNELIFNVRQKDNSFTQATGKIAISGDKEILCWLQEKIEQAIVVSMDEKAWTVA